MDPAIVERPKQKLWIVDDEPDIVEVYSGYFSSFYETTPFTSAVTAMAAIEAGGAPDIILSDMKMPKMSGLEFIKRLRQDGIQTPFVMVSGYAEKAHIIEAIAYEVGRFIEKPCAPNDMKAVIDDLLVMAAKGEMAERFIPGFLAEIETLQSLYSLAVNRYAEAENLLYARDLPLYSDRDAYLAMCRRQDALERNRSKIEADLKALSRSPRAKITFV